MPKRGRKSAITDGDVYYAICDVMNEGFNPSIDRVRAKLGGGSPNRLQGMIKEQSARIVADAKQSTGSPSVQSAPLSDVPLEALALWNAASNQAAERVAGTLESLRSENEDLARTKQGMQERITQLLEELAVLRVADDQRAKSAGEIADQAQQIKHLEIEKAEEVRLREKLEEDNQWLRDQLTAINQEASNEADGAGSINGAAKGNIAAQAPISDLAQSLITLVETLNEVAPGTLSNNGVEGSTGDLEAELENTKSELKRYQGIVHEVMTTARGGGHGRRQ